MVRTFWASAVLALFPTLASGQAVVNFQGNNKLFAAQLNQSFASVCWLSGCSLSGPLSVTGQAFLNGGSVVKSGLSTDTLSVSGITSLLGGGTSITPPLGSSDNTIANTSWVKQQGYVTSTASGVTSFNSRSGAVTLQSSDVTSALGYPPASSTGPSFTGGETISGGLVVDRITISQSGTSPLASVLSLTRSAGGLGDNPLVSGNYTITAADGSQVSYNIANWTTTITGTSGTGPAGDTYALTSNLNINSLRSTVASPTGSQDVAVTGSTIKNTPAGGIPSGRKAQDGWAFWGPLTNNLNAPSSRGGADVNIELDHNTNALDDLATRYIYQGTLHEANATGYPADLAYGLYLSGGSNTTTSMWDVADLGGAYSAAGLDFRFAASYEPAITSATPGSATNSVTVDNVLPLASGGLPLSSTAATTGITANGGASGATLTVSSASALRAGMYIYDLTTPTKVPANTTISSISTNTLTTSASTTVSSSDALLFAPGQKSVTINGDAYTVAGVQFAAQNSPAGTVWFTGNVTVADATNGVKILPSSHTIWLWEGSASAPVAPPGDIAFNRAGTIALSCNSSSSCTDIKSTAPLDLPGSPTSSLQAATKGYVDSAVSTGGTYNPAAVAITGGTIDGVTLGGTTPGAITGTTVSTSNPTWNTTTTAQNIVNFQGKYTGTLSSGPANTAFAFTIGSDALNAQGGASNGFPAMIVQHNFGGSQGGFKGFRTQLTQTSATADTKSTSGNQTVAQFWFKSSYNAGGISGTPATDAYGFNPQVALNQGASWFNLENGGEIDVNTVGSSQPITLGGSITAGDTLSVTFTYSGGGSGSPQTVTSQASGTGDTIAMLGNKLVAAINSNWTLVNSGIGATYDGSSVVTIDYPLTLTVGLSTAVSGSATETMTAGSITSGASVDKRWGLSIVLQNSTTPAITNSGALIIMENGPVAGGVGTVATPGSGWQCGICFGGPAASGDFPVAPTGEIIQAFMQTGNGSGGRNAPFVQPVVTQGLDFQQVNFTVQGGNSFLLPGLQATGAGILEIGQGQVYASSAGFNLDANGWIENGIAISSGGGGGAGNPKNNYFVGDIVYCGNGQYPVTSVNTSTGAVTAIGAAYVHAYVYGSTPSNPRSCSGGSGSNLQVNMTWSAANTIRLNPTSGGNVLIGSGSALATSATSGFPLVPTTAGAPTGSFGSTGQAGMVVDTTDSKVCFNWGAGAKCAILN